MREFRPADAILSELVRTYVPHLRLKPLSQKAIPRLAKDVKAVRAIDQAIRRVPTRHRLVRGNSRSLSSIEAGTVDLVVTSRNHPAPYPIELVEPLIRMFSFVGDTVLDPFLGTGTTSVAAARTGRNSIGFEIEPAYHEMARERLTRELTGRGLNALIDAMSSADDPRFGEGTVASVIEEAMAEGDEEDDADTAEED